MAHRRDHLRRSRVFVLTGLVVLLVAACQGGTTADGEFSDTTGRAHPAETTADEGGGTRSTTERKHRDEKTADKKRRTTDATSQTLGLLADLVETCNRMLAKLAGQQQAYASADNEQGAQLMVEASDYVKDVQEAALSLQRKIASDGDGSPPAAGPSGPSLAFTVEMEEIEKSTNALEDTLAEARRCCGLPSHFLSSDLQELRTKTNSVEQLTIQKIESDRYMANPELTDALKSLVTVSRLPLKSVESDFAVDASGFSTSRFVRWFNKKYGRETDNRMWVKVHLMCGVHTKIVSSVEVSGWTVHDTNYFIPLVEETAKYFHLREVAADKAYLGRKNLHAVEAAGATPFVPFKSNTLPPAEDSTWARMYHLFMFNREEFMAHYHKRSNVESAFSMIKGKFGDSVRSKSETEQVNEALCKVLCHNVCILVRAIHDLGLEPTFGSEATFGSESELEPKLFA